MPLISATNYVFAWKININIQIGSLEPDQNESFSIRGRKR